MKLLPSNSKYNNQGYEKKNDWDDDAYKERGIVGIGFYLCRPFRFAKYFSCSIGSYLESDMFVMKYKL